MSDGPFKMKGFSYPGASPAKFSWKRAMKAGGKGMWGGGILGIIKGVKAGNVERKTWRDFEEEDPVKTTQDSITSAQDTITSSTANPSSLIGLGQHSSTTDNPADDIAVENELANVSNEEKDEIIKKVVKETKGSASTEGSNV